MSEHEATTTDRREAEELAVYELSIEETFAAAHKLRGYRGACENLHGHNWRVKADFGAEDLDRSGMVMDFRDLKTLLRAALQRLDHTYLNDVVPFDKLNPTTENLCRYIAEEVEKNLPGRICVRRITCWESEKSSASFTP
jgi:6-pyruvoyltetrahydropterin/6-carboxytetrahydropterin synthase